MWNGKVRAKMFMVDPFCADLAPVVRVVADEFCPLVSVSRLPLAPVLHETHWVKCGTVPSRLGDQAVQVFEAEAVFVDGDLAGRARAQRGALGRCLVLLEDSVVNGRAEMKGVRWLIDRVVDAGGGGADEAVDRAAREVVSRGEADRPVVVVHPGHRIPMGEWPVRVVESRAVPLDEVLVVDADRMFLKPMRGRSFRACETVELVGEAAVEAGFGPEDVVLRQLVTGSYGLDFRACKAHTRVVNVGVEPAGKESDERVEAGCGQ